jgi:succinate dehydrogenase/fumarate reductase flavoprotein subunit
MKKSVSLVALLVACAVPAFGCDKPSAPSNFPDGKSASKDEMLAAKKEVDGFKRSMEEYISCERNQAKAESAHTELQRVADRFNEQIRVFKAKEG